MELLSTLAGSLILVAGSAWWICRELSGFTRQRRPGTAFHQKVDEMKSMHLFAKQGANRSDSCSYREDLQRSMADKGAISCQFFGETE